jgi:hypothetical protein
MNSFRCSHDQLTDTAPRPDYPLRYLGEHLINQSLQFESNPQKTEIKSYFQYDFDRSVPAPSPSPAQIAQPEQIPETETPAVPMEESDAAMVNGESVVHANGELHNQEAGSPAQDIEMKEGV